MCKECEDKCSTCEDSAGNCLRCTEGLKGLNGDCVERCPDDHLDRAGECVPCEPECDGCTGATFLCERCRGQLIKASGRCIEKCPDAQFYNSQLQICQPCSEGCSACRSATLCSDCFEPLVPINGGCVPRCPTGAQLVNGECVCRMGSLHLGVCVSPCPSRFYSLDRKC